MYTIVHGRIVVIDHRTNLLLKVQNQIQTKELKDHSLTESLLNNLSKHYIMLHNVPTL